MTNTRDNSIVIVGAGIGGLSTALRLAEHGHSVTVLAKSPLDKTASFYAQGGIAAVMNADDSLGEHQSDTLVAGAGLCHADTVAQVIEQGPDCIRWLESLGVRFTRNGPDGELHLTREGGHSRRRIVHADDATGAAVMSVLTARVRSHPGIDLHEGVFVTQVLTSVDLGLPEPNRCVGVRLMSADSSSLETLWADAVVLATGGASGLYEHATNASTGDGIAMAWRAGCRVANLEFMQFHPTCLYSNDSAALLITEAVRGEGGKLKLLDGTTFMRRYDERGDLAPRDVVSRAIVSEMQRCAIDHVFLDISHEPAELIRERFPTVSKMCEAHGYDMTREPIPVVPAAHYTCGGIVVDARGRTDIGQLYALGECSFTGLHGANRLASNSLLEALAFADTIRADIERTVGHTLHGAAASPFAQTVVPANRRPTQRRIAKLTRTLRQLMWARVGIVRTRAGLSEAVAKLEALKAALDEVSAGQAASCAELELRNRLTVADLVVRSAQQRNESRGLHFIVDYPRPQPEPRDTALRPF